MENIVQLTTLETLGIEISCNCNVKCLYCYHEGSRCPQNTLDLHEIKSVLEQARTLGARKLGIVGWGEPALSPVLEDVVCIANNLSYKTTIFTNGTLITAEKAASFVDWNVNVVFKRNSLIPDVQDFLAGKKGFWKRNDKGLRNLLAAGFPSGDCRLAIETVICKQNIHELSELWQWIKHLGAKPLLETMTFQGRAAQSSDLLGVSPQQLKDVFYELQKVDSEVFDCNWLPHPPWPGLTCDRHYHNCLITVTGDVYPCTGLPITIGNIRDTSLSDLLEDSEVIANLRGMPKSLKGSCSTCELNSQCYGCRGNAYHLTGDYLATDPTCWLPNKD